MNYKKFLKNGKAISPIFATLILIAIAVIAGVVVYMFVSGTLATMTSGGTAGQEKISVQAASFSATNTGGTVTVYVEQTGGPLATVNGLIIKDSSGNTIGSLTSLAITSPSQSTLALSTGVLTTVTGTYTFPTGGLDLSASTSYTVTVTTAAGGSFVSPSFLG